MDDIFELILVLVPVAGLLFARFFMNRGKEKREKLRDSELSQSVLGTSTERVPAKKVFVSETRSVSRIRNIETQDAVKRTATAKSPHAQLLRELQDGRDGTTHNTIQTGQNYAYQAKSSMERIDENIQENHSSFRLPQKILGLGDLQRAVIMSEILGKPKALKEN